MTLTASPEASCKVCAKPFLRRNTMHSVCGPRCAMKTVAEQKKANKQETRDRRLAIKSRSDWLKEAQTAFNAYIRARDAELPCVSCGRHHEGQWHAGHYLTVGARPELRFDPLNVHKQCQPCNTHLHGNLVNYRKSLISRIGLESVEKLEGPHPAMHYSVDDLRIIKHTYRQKAKELQA